MLRFTFTAALAATVAAAGAALLAALPARAERADPMHSPQCVAATKALTGAEQEAAARAGNDPDRASRLQALQALRRRAAVACLGGEDSPDVAPPAGARQPAPASMERSSAPASASASSAASAASAGTPRAAAAIERAQPPISVDRVRVLPPRLPVFRPPPPAVVPSPAAKAPGNNRPWIASCDAYGCWGGDGFYYPRQSGSVLVGPQGVCVQAGPGQPCR